MIKLSDEKKNFLRNYIVKLLENVPEGTRITLPYGKDILEQLIFEEREETIAWAMDLEEYEIILDRNDHPMDINDSGIPEEIIERKRIKYIVWSGPFLSKLNLKGISFDDVLWATELPRYAAYAFISRRNNPYDQIQSIDLSNTNADIDLSKSFSNCQPQDSFASDPIEFCNINLEGVDLSNNTLDFNWINMRRCNFRNTRLKITDKKGEFLETTHIDNCDLSGTNLSELTTSEEVMCECLYDSKFQMSGLNIKASSQKERYYKTIEEIIASEIIDGCNFDGKLIGEEKIIKGIIASLEEQVSNIDVVDKSKS